MLLAMCVGRKGVACTLLLPHGMRIAGERGCLELLALKVQSRGIGLPFTSVSIGLCRFAGDLVQNLAAAGQEVPPMLHELAARDPRFRKVRHSLLWWCANLLQAARCCHVSLCALGCTAFIMRSH